MHTYKRKLVQCVKKLKKIRFFSFFYFFLLYIMYKFVQNNTTYCVYIMGWEIEKVEKLKKLWGKGHTASRIAEMIGDVSRNAVIGKAHRLNLAARANTKISQKNKKQNVNPNQEKAGRQSRKSKFKSLLLDKNFEPENPKTLEELDEITCRWPVGHPDEKDFYFCGRKPEKDFSYCKLHILYAFQPKNAKEEDIVSEEDIPQFIEKKIKSA